MAVSRERAIMVAENIAVGHATLIEWGFVHKGGVWQDRKKREVHFITDPLKLNAWEKGSPIYLGPGWSFGKMGEAVFEEMKANRFVKYSPFTGAPML